MFNPKPIFRWLGENRKSLTDLAKMAGIGRVTLHYILNEKHEPSFQSFLAIHKATKIPLSELVTLDNAA